MKSFKLVFICLIFSIFLGCNTNKKTKPTVISTIGMINNLVEEIGKDHVTAIGLMGPGIDPHLYKATANDVKKLANADLIFYNGLHLESKMIEIFEKMSKSKPTIAVTKTISKTKLTAPPEYDGFYDPHVWFDVSLWTSAAEVVKDSLIKLDPNNKTHYSTNFKNYKKKLIELDNWIKNEIKQIPKNKRYLVTAHDAFGYFASAYNFKVIGLQGINTASEAGTKDIQNVTSIIIEKEVPTIFIESSVPIRTIKAVQAAVKAKGHHVDIGEELLTDALGQTGTNKGTYIGMIKHNINSIVTGLK